MAATIIREDFASLAEFARIAGDDSRRQWRKHNKSRTPGDVAFRGTASLQEAVDLALYGWPEGREAMVDAIAAVRPVRDSVAVTRHDVAGAYPDVCRAVAGDPMSMVAVSRQHRSARPIVRIDYSIGVSFTVEAAAVMNRGAALLTVVDQLESQGYSVELRLISKWDGNKHNLYSSVTFKAAGEPLDIDRAAFALVHPAMSRRLNRAFTETHGELEADFGSTYGHCNDDPLDIDDATIFVAQASNDDIDPAAAWSRMAAVFADYLDSGAAQ